MAHRLAVVYGTRPEAIKCAPVIRLLNESADVDVVPIMTGQHGEDVHHLNALFGITPERDLHALVEGQSLSALAARTLTGLAEAFEELELDGVLAQGDTTAVAMAAMAAYYAHPPLPFIHLEAGLRTGELYAPHPEEGNRRIVAPLTSLHLAPTEQAKTNLMREGITPNTIVVTGNTVIDALRYATRLGPPEGGFDTDSLPADVQHLIRDGRRIVLLTTHRRENWNDLAAIGQAVREIAMAFRTDAIVYVPHRNTRLREELNPFIHDLANVVVTQPLKYHPFTHLIAHSYLVLTDSGGIQEEAPSLGKPVLVMRDVTERPEAVQAGTARVIGTNKNAIVAHVSELLSDTAAHEKMAYAVNPYGDGRAAERVVAAIRAMYGLGARLPDFSPTTPLPPSDSVHAL